MVVFNELIFLLHVAAIIASLLIALRLGVQALIGLLCVQTVLMNLFVTKSITLFGLTVTATDAYAVGITLGLNIIQEYYGRAVAQKAILISFFTALSTIVMSQLHLAYAPALTDYQHLHFAALLGIMPRIVVASLVTYLIVMYTDSLLYGFLKKLLRGKFLVARNYASISASQLLDTLLFSFLGLYGIVLSIVPIIVVSYSIKLVVITLATPFMVLTKKMKPAD